ncbi:glycine receptor subunit alpha-4 isoform X3 [Procambarus clarkii]|uniref:glycine receptor subunit alpha-4 isoform X3 n=1 Tax=Procambarus clarkii TaxID=6728 RepID=UPI00374462F7
MLCSGTWRLLGPPRLLLSIVLASILAHTQASSTDGSEGVLTFQDLLPENPKDYDKMRPPKKEGRPTKVYFHVTVMGIDSINENSMTYVADIFFAQSWKDHRLRLPENMTSGYRLLEVDWLNDLWRPDSFFKNAKQVTFQTMTIPNHYVWLHKDSTILYMVKLTLTLSCAMNYAIYPHDTQECKLQMESLSHTTEDLVFDWDADVPLEVDDNIELPQFDLVKNHTADCTQVYITGNFTCLEVVFQLRRRLGYYLFHTYMPTCLIVIMSWVSFWIKPEAAPARVTLGVTSLLTLSTQHAKSQASLPPVSYIKIIDMFMSTCTVFVFLALMEYALVNVVLGDGPDTPPKNPKPTEKEAKSLHHHFSSDKDGGRLGFGSVSHHPLYSQTHYDHHSDLAAHHSNPYLHSNPTHGTITLAHGTPIRGPLTHGAALHSPYAHGPQMHRPHYIHETPAHHYHSGLAHATPMHGPLAHPIHNTLAHGTPMHATLSHGPPMHGALAHGTPIHSVRGHGNQTYDNVMCPPLPSVPPPPPPPTRLPGPTPAQKRRARAILVDRFSRVFFPSTFGLINGVYWLIFWLYL